jgi:hypothetical protein
MSFRLSPFEFITADQANIRADINTDDSAPREQFLDIMSAIKYESYYGRKSYEFHLSKWVQSRESLLPDVKDKLEKLGYKVEEVTKLQWCAFVAIPVADYYIISW